MGQVIAVKVKETQKEAWTLKVPLFLFSHV